MNFGRCKPPETLPENDILPYGCDDPPYGDGWRPPEEPTISETPQDRWLEKRKRLRFYW